MSSCQKIILIFSLAVFFLTSGLFAYGQRSPEVEYPEIGGIRPDSTAISLPDYIKYIFNFSIAISGFIVFAVLVYAGLRYLTSVGNPSAMSDARDRIFSAFLGLVVLLGSYLILTAINPQLILLKVPEIEFFEIREQISPVFPEKDILAYSEIPIGGLIEELLSKERMGRIGDISENIQKTAGDILDKSRELTSMVSQCSCSLASPGCGAGCSGGACAGEPCPGRDAINQKRQELRSLLSVSKNSLDEWQKKLNTEINGSPEPKIIGFSGVYEDLKRAEEYIRNCPFTTSAGGRPQILLAYNNFWEYRRRLEEEQKIKGVEPSRLFDYVSSEGPYYATTFYCAEYIGQIASADVSHLQLGENIISEIEKNLPDEITAKLTKEPICGPEIPLGEAVDNAQGLAQKILADLAIISNNVLSGIGAGQNLINLANPGGCFVGSCQTQCTWIGQECWQPKLCPEEEEEPSAKEPWWLSWAPYFGSVSAQEDCGSFVDCSYCDVSPCSGSVCPGDPAFSGQISASLSEIQNSESQIASSGGNVKNIVEENTEDKSKISKILEYLSSTQKGLGVCYNSKEIQEKAEKGERVSWRELNSCSAIKQSIGTIVSFYNEDGEELKDCYGSSPENPESFDNYFCCQSELFKQ